MESPIALTQMLVPILYDHQIRMSAHEGHIQFDGTDVQLQAVGYPRPGPTNVGIQLDIEIRSQRLLQDRTVAESFSEFGSDLDEAIQKAFHAFCLCSLHTILAVFVNRRLGAGQTDSEYWGSGNRRWEVYLGPITPKTRAPDVKVPIINAQDYGSFLNALRDAYLLEASHELHWLRIYRGSLHGECIAREVLLDNVNWQSGEAILDRWVWPTEPDFYSIREFMIARPVLHEKKWWQLR